MNLFTFLKNNSGKIAKGPLLGGVAALAGIGITMGGYQYDTKNYDNPSRLVTSLRSIQDNSLQDRLEVAENGELTSMSDYLQGNKGGSVRLASSEFRGQLTDVDAMSSNIAYQFSQGDGLSGNAQNIDSGKIGNYQGSGNMGTPGGSISVTPESRASATSGAKGASLPSASMARASGTGISGSSASGAGSNGGRHGGGNGEYKFSGSMPASSSMDDLIALRHDTSLSGNRNTHHNRVGGSGRDAKGNRLEQAAKYSSKAATRSAVAANEGAGAFLEGGLSGGVTVADNNMLDSSGSSSDLSNNLSNIDKRLNSISSNIADKLAKQKEARKKLRNKILILLGSTLAAAAGMYFLISSGTKKIKAAKTPAAKAIGIAMVAAGWALLAGVATFAGFLMKDTIKFMKEFPDAGPAMSIVGMTFAVASVAALTYIGIRATRDGTGASKTTLVNKVKQFVGSNKSKWVKKGTGFAVSSAVDKIFGVFKI
jgi:hypothetical protein